MRAHVHCAGRCGTAQRVQHEHGEARTLQWLAQLLVSVGVCLRAYVYWGSLHMYVCLSIHSVHPLRPSLLIVILAFLSLVFLSL